MRENGATCQDIDSALQRIALGDALDFVSHFYYQSVKER